MKSKLHLILAVLILSTFILCACSTDKDKMNTGENIKTDSNHYYDIDLSTENYWKYLDWDKKNNQFMGVLSYAYYENVIVTIQRKIVSEYTENTYTENYAIELNAAGCKNYSFTEYTFDQINELLNHTGYLGSYSNEITIINISGSIQFSI